MFTCTAQVVHHVAAYGLLTVLSSSQINNQLFLMVCGGEANLSLLIFSNNFFSLQYYVCSLSILWGFFSSTSQLLHSPLQLCLAVDLSKFSDQIPKGAWFLLIVRPMEQFPQVFLVADKSICQSCYYKWCWQALDFKRSLMWALGGKLWLSTEI